MDLDQLSSDEEDQFSIDTDCVYFSSDYEDAEETELARPTVVKQKRIHRATSFESGEDSGTE